MDNENSKEITKEECQSEVSDNMDARAARAKRFKEMSKNRPNNRYYSSALADDQKKIDELYERAKKILRRL